MQDETQMEWHLLNQIIKSTWGSVIIRYSNNVYIYANTHHIGASKSKISYLCRPALIKPH